MTLLKLDEDFSFTIEANGKRARLIVYKDGVENVCRRETFKNLEYFIRSEENHLFKGRLQLHKNLAGICIKVKGKIAGIISAEDFINSLKRAQQ